MNRIKGPRTIRGRLRASFVLMALLPAIGISIGAAILGYVDGRQRANDQLRSVLTTKALELATWSESLQDVLQAALVEEFATERATIVLGLANNQKRSDYYAGAMRTRLRLLQDQSPQVVELLIVDRGGHIVVSTDPANEGRSPAGQRIVQDGMRSPSSELPFDPSAAPWSGNPWVFVARPVLDQDGQVLGAIIARATWDPLVAILADRAGLGTTGTLYLVDASARLLLADDEAPDWPRGLRVLEREGAGANSASRFGIYRDHRGERVIGADRRVPSLGLTLVAEQEQAEAFRVIYATIAINAAISLLAVLLASLAAFLITRSITGPLVNLADTATRIADGDLDRVAPVERPDEIGVLARAFNSMTRQLRDLILNLETRVKERTQALDRRALQMETSAKVSREITSILALDELLHRVVELIRDAFGYYHVNISLLEEDELVLRSSTHETQPSRERTKLETRSLNTEAVRTASAMLANDVQQEPYYLFDAALPETRSELVVPLRLGDRVIGTMDVTSTEPDAFTAQDAVVLQSLGDQVAVAIENTGLYARTRELAVVEERNRLARDLHDSVTQSLSSLGILVEGWRRLTSAGEPYQVEIFLDRVSQITDQALKEMRLMVYELRPSTLEQAGLLGTLHHRLEMVEHRFGIDARLIADEFVDLPAPVEEELYWIAHEALNNSLKHSAATRVTVHIRHENGCLVLEVADNGCGFDTSMGLPRRGVGVSNMAERARQLGGELRVSATPGQGTTIVAMVPEKTKEHS